MLSANLFDTNIQINQNLMRNIVSFRESADLFDDLSDDPYDQMVAIQAELEIKKDIRPSSPAPIYKGFVYNTAIAYPFLTKPYLDTRFGDGSYGVWYGAMDLTTTIYETCFHMFVAILGSEGYPGIVTQERAVFSVHCDGILIELFHKVKEYPDLVSNDYTFCQLIGKKLQKEGHPGLSYASARYAGQNVVIFNPGILDNPQNHCQLTYVFFTKEKSIRVERVIGEELLTINARKAYGF